MKHDSNRRKVTAIITLGALACAAPMLFVSRIAGAAAAEHVLTLNHHELSEPDFKTTVGDRIRIVNGADIAHSIYITYEDGRIVSLDTQLPGTDKTFVVESAGTVLLRCWIHPVIRQELLVAPAK